MEQIIAVLVYVVPTRKADDKKTNIIVQTNPNLGITRIVIPIINPRMLNLKKALVFFSLLKDIGSFNEKRLSPDRTRPRPVKAVIIASVLGQKIGDKIIFGTLLGLVTQNGIAIKSRKAAKLIAPIPSLN